MNQKTILRIAAGISGISGVIILVGVVYPIVSYNATYGKNFSELVSPLNENPVAQTKVAGATSTDNITASDFTRASNWFVGGAKSSDFNASKVQYFTIKIGRAHV